jgi:tRNA-dihydrouridine synthase
MIGRAIFNDPFIFSANSTWATTPQKEKLQMYKKHIELFISTYPPEERGRNWQSLKRMAKIYVHGIENASVFRDKLMRSETVVQMLVTLDEKITSL